MVQGLLDSNPVTCQSRIVMKSSIYENRHDIVEGPPGSMSNTGRGRGSEVGMGDKMEDKEEEDIEEGGGGGEGMKHSTGDQAVALLQIVSSVIEWSNRHGHTVFQKGCAILSIMANSTNSHCNAFQAVQGFFLESVNAPKRIIDVLAHGGWSISVVSIVNIVWALTKEQKQEIRKLSQTGLCAIAYDNLDFDFCMKEPTVENAGTFASITTGSFIQLTPDTMLDDISFSRELWERSDLNPCGPKDSMPPTSPPYEYVVDWIKDALPCVNSAILWFIKSIVVEDYLKSEYRDLLSPIPSSKWIEFSKSVQQPAQAMHIKASETDGNVEIVENLECQLGTLDKWYETYVRLCHSDLRTQE